jgi:hypothetical protein
MKVQAGRTYFYHANLLDAIDGRTNLTEGEEVQVVNLPGCPRANTMNHAHVERLDGSFGGLVHCNSLHSRADYMTWLRAKIKEKEQHQAAL